MNPTATVNSSRVLAYLQLIRAPNVFTVLANGLMGYAVVAQGWTPWAPLALVLLASSLLYSAGMVLNDVYDVEVDRRERPQRPLPSGRIDVAFALRLGMAMLVAGMFLATLAALAAGLSTAAVIRTAVLAAALAGAIVFYDALAKQTVAGPLVMGSCRLLNVLLAMSVAPQAEGPLFWTADTVHRLLVAGGIGLYIVGVTWFARSEAADSSRGQLTGALSLMLAGIALLAVFPWFVPGDYRLHLESPLTWIILLALLSFPIVRNCLAAVAEPQPRRVQWAVKHSILSLIPLDAAVVLLVGHWAPAIFVFALLVPSLLLGRWIYST